MAESLNALNASLLKQLECPVCFETCLPPIKMCVRTHIVCSKCAPSLTECSVCREPIASERSWFAEDMCSKVKLPCRFNDNGCSDIFNLNELETHLPVCTFKNYDCLIGGKLLDGKWNGGCVWKGPLFELLDHVQSRHENSCFKGTIDRWVRARNFTVDPHIRLVSAHDELFWSLELFLHERKEIEFVVIFIGRKEKALKFEYLFEIGFEENGKLTFQNPTMPLNFDESRGKTLILSDAFRIFLERPNGRLPFKLTILEK